MKDYKSCFFQEEKTFPRVESFPLLRHSHGYLKNMRFRRGSSVHRGAFLNIHRYKLKASSCPDIYRNSMISLMKEADEVRRYILFCYLLLLTRQLLFILLYTFIVFLFVEVVLRNTAFIKKHGRFFILERITLFTIFFINNFTFYVGGGSIFLFGRTFNK